MVGPVHGLVTHISTIGAELKVENGDLMITTSLGAKINLLEDPLTHIQACLREACRHKMIGHLRSRNDDDKKAGRQDMQDIPDYVDADISLTLLRKINEP